MQRRTFLASAAGWTTAAAMAPSLSSCSTSRLAAREAPSGIEDPRLRAAAYGLLASSPHNAQPWKLRLLASGGLDVHVDRDRLLPETDPVYRQVYVGQGTFLEQLALGARVGGQRALIETFPEGPGLDAPVARVRLQPAQSAAAAPGLGAHLTARQTNKRPYEARPVDRGALRAIEAEGTDQASIMMLTDENRLVAIRSIAIDAMAIEVADERRNAELLEWFRFSDDEFEARRDGIGLPQNGITGFRRWFAESFIVRRSESTKDPESAFSRGAIDLLRKQVEATPAFAMIVTPQNDRRHQVEAGRVYARLQLRARALGVQTHPVSQALQEYPAMRPLYDGVHALVDPGETIQMLVRLGHAKPVPFAPRRPIRALLA